MSGDHEGCGCGCGGHEAPVRPGFSGRDWRAAADDEVVCPCRGITKAQVVEAIASGAFTLPLLKISTGAGRGKDCRTRHPRGRSCELDLEDLLAVYAEPGPEIDRTGCGH
ncbi:MAG: (2Fe-2S)-binding protein [Deltaproteobacteria bacterium]|nr:(2Fe-2S)-binding protein [Deltaproteobacteria bacterium]